MAKILYSKPFSSALGYQNSTCQPNTLLLLSYPDEASFTLGRIGGFGGRESRDASITKETAQDMSAGDSITTLGNLIQCTVVVKKVFADVQMEPPGFHFVSIASGPVTGHH